MDRVFVENDWYDGPCSGVAEVDGTPHYFSRLPGQESDGQFHVWAAAAEALAWEREQWAIFVAWNDRYEAGDAGTESHPATGGVDARYDELTSLLHPYRQVPDDARILLPEWQWRTDAPSRYHADGVDYRVRWRTP